MSEMQFQILILEELEQHLGFKLDNKQLDFIFNKSKRLLFTSPRKYGKDTILAIRLILRAMSKPNQRYGIISVTHIQNQLLMRFIADLLSILNLNPVRRIMSNPQVIELNNNSRIYFLSGNIINNCLGQRFNEAFIMEAYLYNDKKLKEIIQILSCCTVHEDNSQLTLIGTPGIATKEINKLLNSSYWDKLCATLEDTPRLHSLIELRSEMDEETFRRTILGEFIS